MSVYYTTRMLRSLLWSAGSLSRCKHIHALLPSPPPSPWRREVTQPLNAAGFLSRCVELQWECVKRAGRPNVKRGFWMVECFRMLTISNKLVSYMSSSLPFLNCSSQSLSDKHLAVSLQESIDISILRFSIILNSLLACSLTNQTLSISQPRSPPVWCVDSWSDQWWGVERACKTYEGSSLVWEWG